jgi:hypothetical protein
LGRAGRRMARVCKKDPYIPHKQGKKSLCIDHPDDARVFW